MRNLFFNFFLIALSLSAANDLWAQYGRYKSTKPEPVAARQMEQRFALMGVILEKQGSSPQNVALIFDRDSKSTLFIRPGEALPTNEGAVLTELDSRQAVFVDERSISHKIIRDPFLEVPNQSSSRSSFASSYSNAMRPPDVDSFDGMDEELPVPEKKYNAPYRDKPKLSNRAVERLNKLRKDAELEAIPLDEEDFEVLFEDDY